MAGTNLNRPVLTVLIHAHAPPLSAYTSRKSRFLPTFSTPLINKQRIRVPYAPVLEPGVARVPDSRMIYSYKTWCAGWL